MLLNFFGISFLTNFKKEYLTASSVSRHKGLFYFDASFRPIPLEQHFLGIRGKVNSAESRKNFDTVTSQKVTDLVMQGHQVMVFVHSRKETVKTAMVLREAAALDGNLDSFGCADQPQFRLFRQKIGESRNKEMKDLFDSGFGIHHAGMLRSDRNLMEKMFSDKVIKVGKKRKRPLYFAYATKGIVLYCNFSMGC